MKCHKGQSWYGPFHLPFPHDLHLDLAQKQHRRHGTLVGVAAAVLMLDGVLLHYPNQHVGEIHEHTRSWEVGRPSTGTKVEVASRMLVTAFVAHFPSLAAVLV